MTGLLVVASGGIGAGLRFLVSGWMTRRANSEFPWGTAVVNGVGSLLLGGVVGAGLSGSTLVVGAGFASGFTTYSTWMVESIALWDEGRGGRMPAVVNWLGMFVVGLGLAGMGWAIGQALGSLSG